MERVNYYSKYKESDVEWIGKVPHDWKKVKLKRCFKVKNGREIENELDKDEPNAIDVYGSGGVFKKTDKTIFDSESVLFGRKGTIGKPMYVNTPFWTVDTMYYTHFEKNMIPRFFYYMLSIFPWDMLATKTALPSIVGSEVENSFVLMPNENEQFLISSFLDQKTSEIDSLIADKEKLIELLEEKRQAIITEAVTKGLNSDVKMKNSGVEWIGEIPKHWDIKKVKHVSTLVGSGKTPRGGGEVYSKKGITFIRSMNVHFEGLKLDDVVYIDEGIDQDMKTTRVFPKDVLLNITGASIGRTCIVPKGFSKGNVNQHVCIIRPTINVVPFMLSKIMASRIIQNQIYMSQTGSSREGMNFNQIKNLLFPLPNTIEEQNLISDYIDSKSKQITQIIKDVNKQIGKLKEYRQSLIFEAVTGKIDVRNYNQQSS